MDARPRLWRHDRPAIDLLLRPDRLPATGCRRRVRITTSSSADCSAWGSSSPWSSRAGTWTCCRRRCAWRSSCSGRSSPMRSSSPGGAGSRSATSWSGPSGCGWLSSRVTAAPTSSMPSGKVSACCSQVPRRTVTTTSSRGRPGWPVPYPPLTFLAHLPGYLLAGKDGVFYAEAAFSLVPLAIFVGTRRAPLVDPRAACAGGLRRQRQHRLRRGGRQHRDQLGGAVLLVAIVAVGLGLGRRLGRSAGAHRGPGGGAAAGHEAIDDLRRHPARGGGLADGGSTSGAALCGLGCHPAARPVDPLPDPRSDRLPDPAGLGHRVPRRRLRLEHVGHDAEPRRSRARCHGRAA